jgi:cytochrome c-type biogenesis protein CcmH
MAEPGRIPLWVRVALPAVVLVAALIVGSGALDSTAPTGAQRAASIEAVVRCPSCTDVSVANSTESTALAVRHEIEHEVAAGRSTAQIEQRLVAQYGQTILLLPPDPGGVPVIWLVPAALGGGTLVAIAILFWRRSKQFAALREGPDS